MDCVVVPATPADREAVVATVVAAFAQDPAFRYFFPDEATFDEYAATFVGYLFDRRVNAGSVWICSGGAVAALWDIPTNDPAAADSTATAAGDAPGLEAPTLAAPGLAAPELAAPELDLPADVRARIDTYDAAVEAALPRYRHWYLGILATRPDHAGRGLGRRLMGAGVAAAHADGLPAVLETMNPSNVDLYIRAGWQLYGQTDAPDVPTTWVLVNLPASAHDPDQPTRIAA